MKVDVSNNLRGDEYVHDTVLNSPLRPFGFNSPLMIVHLTGCRIYFAVRGILI